MPTFRLVAKTFDRIRTHRWHSNINQKALLAWTTLPSNARTGRTASRIKEES
ncbi:hypothetical protein JG687_00018164 [Phytophthora cactorum]|uniref:Uncharacterized protein n=1 Tax=Phytophthora cactorum TaxID=29920 RepID=A0A8T1TPJ1_9STRA|nr:hypothetical protein JG687_00018164 [Phytophthora cactorum]